MCFISFIISIFFFVLINVARNEENMWLYYLAEFADIFLFFFYNLLVKVRYNYLQFVDNVGILINFICQFINIYLLKYCNIDLHFFTNKLLLFIIFHRDKLIINSFTFFFFFFTIIRGYLWIFLWILYSRNCVLAFITWKYFNGKSYFAVNNFLHLENSMAINQKNLKLIIYFLLLIQLNWIFFCGRSIGADGNGEW